MQCYKKYISLFTYNLGNTMSFLCKCQKGKNFVQNIISKNGQETFQQNHLPYKFQP